MLLSTKRRSILLKPGKKDFFPPFRTKQNSTDLIRLQREMITKGTLKCGTPLETSKYVYLYVSPIQACIFEKNNEI